MEHVLAEIESLKPSITLFKNWLCEATAHGLAHTNAVEVQALTDAIKDLSEAMKNCMKIKYYKTIIEAMEEEDTLERIDQFHRLRGYDHYRYRNGHFAPKGHGHRVRSYIPEWDETVDWYRDPHPQYLDDFMTLGYQSTTPTREFDHHLHMPLHTSTELGRHESIGDNRTLAHESIDTMERIWSHAAPELRSEMVANVTKLLEMMKKG